MNLIQTVRKQHEHLKGELSQIKKIMVKIANQPSQIVCGFKNGNKEKGEDDDNDEEEKN